MLRSRESEAFEKKGATVPLTQAFFADLSDVSRSVPPEKQESRGLALFDTPPQIGHRVYLIRRVTHTPEPVEKPLQWPAYGPLGHRRNDVSARYPSEVIARRFVMLLYIHSPETDQLRNIVGDTTFCPVNLSLFEGASKELPSISYTLHNAEDTFYRRKPARIDCLTIGRA